MGSLADRLAHLAPERRRALEHLLRQREDRPNCDAQERGDSNRLSAARSDDGLNAQTRRFYESLSEELDRTDLGQFARFLNYGYVPDGSAQHATVQLPSQLLNKSSVQLVLELVGDCDLTARSVLDVGCGRGGLVETIAAYFAPRVVVGLDLCRNAVAFASTLAYPAVAFVQGDAERLPMASGSFDVITNLESSHTYPSINAFYAEVARVLRYGGHFLYSDAVRPGDVPARMAALHGVGLALEIERDITSNVLLACEAAATRRMASFHRTAPDRGLEAFLAVPGSAPYEALRTREWMYFIYRFVKRDRGSHGKA